tara:strand:+ start:283 stop:495 length:213 start_codon:yes stop_codon:yes gene_type:complete
MAKDNSTSLIAKLETKKKNGTITKKETKKLNDLLISTNKLKETTKGVLTGGKMTDTLKRLGIDPKKLRDS